MTYIAAMFPDNRIRELRKKAGLTQTQLGERVGLHQTQIGKIENNDRNLTIEWARRIAAALDTQVADILGDDDNPMRLSEDEQLLIRQFRAAPLDMRSIALQVIKPLLGQPDQLDDRDQSAA